MLIGSHLVRPILSSVCVARPRMVTNDGQHHRRPPSVSSYNGNRHRHVASPRSGGHAAATSSSSSSGATAGFGSILGRIMARYTASRRMRTRAVCAVIAMVAIALVSGVSGVRTGASMENGGSATAFGSSSKYESRPVSETGFATQNGREMMRDDGDADASASSSSSSSSTRVGSGVSSDVAEIDVKKSTTDSSGSSYAKSSTALTKSSTSEPLGRGTVAKSMPVPIPKATRLRVLVTGGAGFVGSHLVDRLMERGNIVIVADNFFTGRKENIMHHLQNPFFELIRHDVVEPMLVEVDQIYHLACPASPVHYKHNPVKTIKTSVMGTLNMLGLAKRVGARMLLTSTSEVYGDPLQHPQKEDYWGNVNPIGVRSCYDEGKRVAETLCFDYHRQEGVDIRIARIFNTYGPRMALEDGRVVSNFVSQALRGEPLTVYGDGKQTRSFQYVDDLVAGLMALMDNEDEIGPVNIGNPGEFTMIELAEVVKEVVNKDAKIEFKENTADDPGRRRPDISLAKKALGWEPKITLKEGLPKMVEDFRERLNLQKTEL